jgi:hypothetical protein
MFEKALGPDHPQTAQTLGLLGAARLGQRKAAQALPLLERAAALEVKHKVDALELSRTRFSLARALWESGGDRGRAKALAAEAREGNVAAGPAARRELAAVETWLQARR